MGRYILRRLLIAIPTLLAITFVVFALLSLAPTGGRPLVRRRRLMKTGGPDRSQNRRCELHGVVIEGIEDLMSMARVLPA